MMQRNKMPVSPIHDHHFIDSDGPLITIVTVVRNGEQTLEQTMLSVLNQSYKKIEYIVIDGCSTDGTIDIIQKYRDRIAYWISEPDKGIYDAMNKGIAAATGDLIGLLNSDDYYEQGALEYVANTYQLNKSRDNLIIYGDYYILDDSLQVKTEFRSDLRFWKGMTVCHQAMFVSRGLYHSLGRYDTGLKFAADYAFFVDAIQNQARFIPTHQFLVTFRNTGATYTKVSASNRESLSILRKRFGLFSKYFLLYFSVRFIQSTLITAIKRIVKRTVNSEAQKMIKIVYNVICKRHTVKQSR